MRGDLARAALVPHGGFCNSGFVAGRAYCRLAPGDWAVVVGNSHAGAAPCTAASSYACPLGSLSPGPAIDVPVDGRAHGAEHSIENQVPFLVARGFTRMTPLLVGAVSDAEACALGAQVAALVRRGAVLVGTTDFSHEGPAYGTGRPGETMGQVTERTRRMDAPLLAAIQDQDIGAVRQLAPATSMCGPGSLAVLLHAVKALGWSRTEMLGYVVNTEITPCDSTTGFAAALFT